MGGGTQKLGQVDPGNQLPTGPGSHAWAATHPNYAGPGFPGIQGPQAGSNPGLQGMFGPPQADQGQTPGMMGDPNLMAVFQRLFSSGMGPTGIPMSLT
jgi:hypothetical protein